MTGQMSQASRSHPDTGGRKGKTKPSAGLQAARITAGSFLLLIAIGAVLLALPISTRGGGSVPPLDGIFTATSAVCLTGLIVVDTAEYWTPFGQAVILVLIQVGGLGIMTLATLTGMILIRKVSVRSRRLAEAESRPFQLGGAKRTIVATVLLTFVTEGVIAAVLAWRFYFHYGLPLGYSLWSGVFHSVSAFNNAGFSLRSQNLIEYHNDWFILSPIMLAIVLGGLGYSVLAELVRRIRIRMRERGTQRHRALGPLSVTTRMTLFGTAALLAVGFVVYLLAEWNRACASFDAATSVLNALFGSVTARTAGFNAIDYSQVSDTTLLTTDALMFIGGGSASTAGGVKITTLVVLLAAMWTELVGEKEVIIGHRRIPEGVVRQAMTVTGAGALVVCCSVILLRILNPHLDPDYVTFETISAFGTVGLSAGITAQLTAVSQGILCLLMYLGRIGPITLVAALAAKKTSRHFHYPEERPLIG
ncbi:TrkH family potassium uptake protein [Corynebacterium anserum]|uniref:TrkH family potassium uptake protein n=1 Tax=Corynebacterium anserum TaxID=2684406 RepID=UPI0028BDC6A6|nr:potassium transporter TrkG [Corynebacterium anserum]